MKVWDDSEQIGVGRGVLSCLIQLMPVTVGECLTVSHVRHIRQILQAQNVNPDNMPKASGTMRERKTKLLSSAITSRTDGEITSSTAKMNPKSARVRAEDILLVAKSAEHVRAKSEEVPIRVPRG